MEHQDRAWGLHLLKRDPGFLGKEHTGIPTSLFTVDSMLSNSKLKDCANLKTAENAFDSPIIASSKT